MGLWKQVGRKLTQGYLKGRLYILTCQLTTAQQECHLKLRTCGSKAQKNADRIFVTAIQNKHIWGDGKTAKAYVSLCQDLRDHIQDQWERAKKERRACDVLVRRRRALRQRLIELGRT